MEKNDLFIEKLEWNHQLDMMYVPEEEDDEEYWPDGMTYAEWQSYRIQRGF